MLLAVFSVGLAALFYFKATETSNTFYDNTYKFSQDIAQLLARMESGFGEKLRHLDDSYSNMRQHLEKYSGAATSVTDTRNELKEEEKKLQEKLRERDRMIESLAAKAQMQDGEKSEFLKQVKEREKELETARQEIRLLQAQMRSSADPDAAILVLKEAPPHLRMYIRHEVLDKIGLPYAIEAPHGLLKRRFLRQVSSLPSGFIEDMRKFGYCDEESELTAKGIQLIRALARQTRSEKE